MIGACDADVAPSDDDEAEIPDTEACDAVQKWPGDRAPFEEELIRALDIARAGGGSCPTGETFDPAPPLRTTGALTCAARDLAVYLAELDNLAHVDGNGDSVVERLADAGWETSLATELIASGDVAPSRIVDDLWLASGPHCAAALANAWTRVGVAYHENPVPPEPDPEGPTIYGAYWVVVLSTPPR